MGSDLGRASMDQMTGASAVGQRGRRRDDLLNAEAMLGIVRFLMARPTGDQLCQHLVLRVLSEHETRQATLMLFGVDGSLHVIGSFGSTAADLSGLSSLLLWAPEPLADTVRTGEPVFLTSDSPARTNYPRLNGGHGSTDPLVTWPLSLPNQRVGALQLTFASEPDENALRADLNGVGAVLALYLSLVTGAGTEHGPDGSGSADGGLTTVNAVAAESPGVSRRKAAPKELSERQLIVLRMMAKGLTNAQIAKRIGFSESTVRQETMVVYRYFGVGGRHEAVRLADMRGMLTE